jgi:hypothetical protein
MTASCPACERRRFGGAPPHFTGVPRPAGPVTALYTLRDGKTVRAELYPDTALMERVYGKKQVAAG